MTFRCRALLLRKEHVRFCRSTTQYHLMDKTCNTFGVATSPIVSDLSTSFNGMNLNMWSCTSSSLFLAQCSLDFRSTKRALFEVLSTKSSTKRQKKKKQGTLKALLNPNFTSTKLSALVYNFRKEFELDIKQTLFDASHVLLSRPPNHREWTRSQPLS